MKNSMGSLSNVFPTSDGVVCMRKTPLLAVLLVGLLFAVPSSSLVTADSTSSNSDEMIRIVMLPPEAEATGMFVDENGNFFVNAMHPDIDSYKATVGVINGVDWNNLPEHVPALSSTSSASDVWHGIRTGYGEYQVLLQSGDLLSDGNRAGGIYAADDGQELLLSQKPDYNAFVPLNEDGTQGYLYTAWEDRPAGISQIHIEWNSTANEWDVVNSQMLNLSNINGAWVLCFGSMSPWGTPLFSEELYFDDTEEWNDDSFRYHSDQLFSQTTLASILIPMITDTSSKWMTLNRSILLRFGNLRWEDFLMKMQWLCQITRRSISPTMDMRLSCSSTLQSVRVT